MKNKYKFSYIIPYRKSTVSRERNLTIVLKWLRDNFSDFEVIIVEMDIMKTFTHDNSMNIKHVFIPDGSIFSRSKARNAGACAAESDILIFADNDIIMNPGSIESCLELCKKYDAVNPFNLFIDLTETDLIRYKIYSSNFTTLFSTPLRQITASDEYFRENLNFACGLFIIKRDAFFKIGCWPEEIKGWGAEDDIIAYKIDRFLDSTTVLNNAFHLPHERLTFDKKFHPHFDYNCEIMNTIFKLSDQALIRYCEICRIQTLKSYGMYLEPHEKKRLEEIEVDSIRNNDNLDIAQKTENGVVYYPLKV